MSRSVFTHFLDADQITRVKEITKVLDFDQLEWACTYRIANFSLGSPDMRSPVRWSAPWLSSTWISMGHYDKMVSN